jgi:hypothetical protein
VGAWAVGVGVHASRSALVARCRLKLGTFTSTPVAVTAVTGFPSSTPLFFGHRATSALPVTWRADGCDYHQGGSIPAACA